MRMSNIQSRVYVTKKRIFVVTANGNSSRGRQFNF